MTSADVVERVYRQARSALGCPKPQEAVLRSVVEHVVRIAMRTKGEYMTVTIRPLRRLYSHIRFTAPCVVAWLGLQDCVFEYKGGRAVLRLPCVREKLGI